METPAFAQAIPVARARRVEVGSKAQATRSRRAKAVPFHRYGGRRVGASSLRMTGLSPASVSENVRALAKERISAALRRDLPRLLDYDDWLQRGGVLSRKQLSLLADGRTGVELFADDVEWSFPVFDSFTHAGRRTLKFVLASLPWQASMGRMSPTVRNVVVDSPTEDLLIARYEVHCNVLEDENQYFANVPSHASEAMNASAQPKRAVLKVRTRVRVGEHGLITEWMDTWDHSVKEFLDIVSSVSSVCTDAKSAKTSPLPENKKTTTAEGTSMSSSTMPSSQEAQPRPGEEAKALPTKTQSTHSYSRREERQLRAERTIADLYNSSYTEDGTIDSAFLSQQARGLSQALPLNGPELSSEALTARVSEVIRYLREEFPLAGTPSKSWPRFSSGTENNGNSFLQTFRILSFAAIRMLDTVGLGGNDEARRNVPYDHFHEDFMLETPTLLSQGVEAMEMLHHCVRLEGWLRWADVRVHCIEVDRVSPTRVVARYVLVAKGWGGICLIRQTRSQFWINRAGLIVHQFDSSHDHTDEFAHAFARLQRKKWIW